MHLGTTTLAEKRIIVAVLYHILTTYHDECILLVCNFCFVYTVQPHCQNRIIVTELYHIFTKYHEQCHLLV